MRIPIFLSYSTPYTVRQEKFIADVKNYLLARGLEPRTLGVTDYDTDEPLVASRRLMMESNGLITMAFRRYFIANLEIVDGGTNPNNLTADFVTRSIGCDVIAAFG